MTMTGKERAALRAEAHHLTAQLHIGHQGVSDALVQSLEDLLRTRELVKVQLGRNADVTVRDAAEALAAATGASIVQVIGKTATLFRENPNLAWRKNGELPPWRR